MKDLYPEFDSPSGFGPESSPGVYGLFIERMGVLILIYIGSAKNIKKRILKGNHLYLKLWSQSEPVVLRTILTEDYQNIESKLIKKYNPAFNLYGRSKKLKL